MKFNSSKRKKKSNLQECLEVARKMRGDSRNKAEREPAAGFNESREVRHEWVKVSTSPSNDIKIQFISIKHESEHRAKLAGVRG